MTLGWVLHFKMLSRSSFNSVLGVVYPLFFATVAFFMYREAQPARAALRRRSAPR